MRRDRALGWERAALGTAISSPSSMDEVVDLLPSDFTGGHQSVWAEILALHRREALDHRALIEALRTAGVLAHIGPLADDEINGEDYLEELIQHRGTSMVEYADRVQDASLKRELLRVATLMRIDAESEGMSAIEATDEAERRLLGLRRARGVDMGVSMAELVNIFDIRTAGMLAGTIRPAWVPDLLPIRELVGFVEEKDFIVNAARPGEGKSSLMRYLFIKASQSGMTTLIFNLENSELEYAKYGISMLTGIDSNLLKDPKLLTSEQMTQVREAGQQLARLPIYIKTMGAPSVQELQRVAHQHISRHNVQLIGVDYLQLIRNGKTKRVDDVSDTTSMLRALAMNTGVPIMANSQLSRNIEHRGVGSEPMLADLRESGSIEQDATMVWFQRFLWASPTPDQLRLFPDNLDSTGNLRLDIKALPVRNHVAKNRNGSVGVSRPYLWVKATNNFLPLERMT